MPWSFSCAHCKSRDVQATADEIQCLVCGRLTDKNGVLISHEEQHTSEEL